MAPKEITPEDLFKPSRSAAVKAHIRKNNVPDTDRQLRSQFLAIKYQMEDYIEAEPNPDEQILSMLDFVKMFLKSLNITKKDLAEHLNMKDSNLHKYLVGERKLNAEIVLKLSSFTHTKPEYWYRVQIKNQMIELQKETHSKNGYEQYDYQRMLRK